MAFTLNNLSVLRTIDRNGFTEDELVNVIGTFIQDWEAGTFSSGDFTFTGANTNRSLTGSWTHGDYFDIVATAVSDGLSEAYTFDPFDWVDTFDFDGSWTLDDSRDLFASFIAVVNVAPSVEFQLRDVRPQYRLVEARSHYSMDRTRPEYVL